MGWVSGIVEGSHSLLYTFFRLPTQGSERRTYSYYTVSDNSYILHHQVEWNIGSEAITIVGLIGTVCMVCENGVVNANAEEIIRQLK